VPATLAAGREKKRKNGAQMKAPELRDLSLDELKKRLADERENLANLRFQLSTSQLESPIKVRSVRRDIARLMTVIRHKEAKS
jgi:large subunit ribosomal protein L29